MVEIVGTIVLVVILIYIHNSKDKNSKIPFDLLSDRKILNEASNIRCKR